MLSVQRTLPGRLFLMTGSLLATLWAVQLVTPLPTVLDIFRKVVKVGFLISVGWLVLRAFLRGQRQWLWAVRRKLILSYVFFGLFPVALMAVLVAVAGLMIYMNVAGYLFLTGYQSTVFDVTRVVETSLVELGPNPADAALILTRRVANLQTIFPGLSMAVFQSDPKGQPEVVLAGSWRHMPAPTALPTWVVNRAQAFRGTIGVVSSLGPAGEMRDQRLVIRVVMASSNGKQFVMADLPVDGDVVGRLFDQTAAHMEGISFTATNPDAVARPSIAPLTWAATHDTESTTIRNLFRRTVVTMDFTDWQTGNPGRAAISIEAPARRLYDRMASLQPTGLGDFRLLLVVLAGLFLVIQIAAVIGGVALARRITSAVHSLFVGTAKIGQGDFTHRIPIGSNDQLGDLAGSFNNMGASIEHLRHIEREKLRLDEELQIARKIQRSLLPATTPSIDGLCIADLCEPALEVGGDYYDFFQLGPRQLGVLVADVSGKGTSAALYMAELKGLVLALSRTHRSPRALLIELNDLLADHLDNRSFITMTYAVIDLDAATLTLARAGHTPMLFCSSGESRVVVPDGMVLGLRLPGAAKRFSDIIKEHRQAIAPGDVVVLYTDGITEAMNLDGDLFGDEALSRVVSANCGLDSSGIRERILRDVRAFVGDAEPHDDMTMVVVKVQAGA
ncbi:MAG: HAMP domain-containing protein [Acidobacteria bacterium]|nr:MAG: HAMP domain-containing protein [Acidobacteriota bacterium]